MASIFTFDPNPPRVSSPWSTPRASTPIAITRLEAEPQEGPTEYKLHLLLRPRREYRSSSTGLKISGSYRSVSASPKVRAVPDTNRDNSPPLLARSAQTRQQRLEQLTTQLLWRLQQSCPLHTTSVNNQIAPNFPDAGKIRTDADVGPPIPGLEESRGALYEIGVADDGTFVGLTGDEMDESLQNLGAMAASLGCLMEVKRKVAIGQCEWYDSKNNEHPRQPRQDRLWVAEAYIKPNLAAGKSDDKIPDSKNAGNLMLPVVDNASPAPAQLRVSLTGATMSGKSTLLGNLTTATHDNGRGKSRLNLFKHRHEILSGITSSVTQELVGYSTREQGTIGVVNYASDNVSTWTDIHGCCTNVSGRLVLLSDSAGHPRYRRTTVRGLIGWAPDWTLLCIPADNGEDTTGMIGSTPSAEELLGASSVGVDLSQAHLELCLKLRLRLVIIVTKLDLASSQGLRQSLAKVLSTLKSAGRTPKIMANGAESKEAVSMMTIPKGVYESCQAVETLLHDDDSVVPIILTSAIKGSGISTLHALLSMLPAPAMRAGVEVETLFHIEDTYRIKKAEEVGASLPVLSGVLRGGRLCVGDELRLGPITVEAVRDINDVASDRPFIPTSHSFPGALNDAKGLIHPTSTERHEWLKVKIISLRYLRQPVTAMFENQVGTVGVQYVVPTTSTELDARIRKGMVLVSGSPKSRRGFIAEFARSDVDSLSIGMGVVVYVASVRASAKVIAGAIPEDQMESSIESLQALHTEDEDDGQFAFRFEDDEVPRKRNKIPRLHVTFQFIATKEYIDIGSQVLVMPGGGPGLYGGMERGEKGMAGLEGFVGTVIDGY